MAWHIDICIVLRVVIIMCAGVTRSDQDNGFLSTVKQAVYDSFDNNKSITHNYFTILTLLCPQSVFCSEVNINTTSVNGVEEFWADENITEDYYRASDTVRKARRYLSEVTERLPGCCEPCSCEKSCVERQTCCPEYEFKMANTRSASINLQECVFANVRAYTQNVFNKPDTWGMSYFMVTSCTGNTSESEHISKCLSPNKENIEEIRPVYSKLSERIYKNRYCAECNNDQDFLPWSIEVNIYNRITLTEKIQIPQTPKDMYKMIVNTRYFKFFDTYFYPPESVDFKENSCYYRNNKDFMCDQPDSDKEDDMTALMSRLCTVDTSVYHTALNTFENIFCYLCHSVVIDGKSIPCDSSSRSVSTSFAAVLVPLPPEEEELSIAAQGPCSCSDYFNPKLGECRELRCPPGTYFAQCDCVEFMKITRMLTHVYLETSPRGHIEELLQPAISNAWLNEFLISMKRLLKYSWTPTQIKTTLMFRELSKVDRKYVKLYTTFLLQFTDDRADRDSFKPIFDTLCKGVRIKVDNDYLTVKLGILYEVYQDGPIFIPTHDHFKNNDTRLENIFDTSDLVQPTKLSDHLQVQPLNKLIYCRRVVLNDSEVELLKNNTNMMYPSLGYVFKEEDSSLCLEDYIDMMVNSCTSLMLHGGNGVILVFLQTFIHLFLIIY